MKTKTISVGGELYDIPEDQLPEAASDLGMDDSSLAQLLSQANESDTPLTGGAPSGRAMRDVDAALAMLSFKDGAADGVPSPPQAQMSVGEPEVIRPRTRVTIGEPQILPSPPQAQMSVGEPEVIRSAPESGPDWIGALSSGGAPPEPELPEMNLMTDPEARMPTVQPPLGRTLNIERDVMADALPREGSGRLDPAPPANSAMLGAPPNLPPPGPPDRNMMSDPAALSEGLPVNDGRLEAQPPAYAPHMLGSPMPDWAPDWISGLSGNAPPAPVAPPDPPVQPSIEDIKRRIAAYRMQAQ